MEIERMTKVPRKDVEVEENLRSPNGQNKISDTDNTEGMNRDALKLLAIFPEEIWLLIFEKISDATDKENVCNSSLFFRDILFDKRVFFLFPKVWNILGVRYHKNKINLEETKDKCYYSRRENQRRLVRSPPPERALRIQCDTCRRTRCSRWFSEILKYRVVCWKWCDAIDKFYEDPPLVIQTDKVLEKSGTWILNEFELREPREIRQVRRHFEESHLAGDDGKCERNPFVGRRFNMKVNARGGAVLQYVTDDLLKKYGQHIWYSKITMTLAPPWWCFWYMFFRRVLQRCPNLKTLDFEWQILNEDEDQPISAEQFAGLKREINSYPLPTLKHLESLRTDKIIAPIFDEMILRYNFVTKLEVTQSYCLTREEYNLFRSSMPNLKKLKIGIYTDEAFQIFENGEGTMPQLEELELDLKWLVDLDWRRIFTTLEGKWGDTLKTLKMKLPKKQGRRYASNDYEEDVEDEYFNPEEREPTVEEETIYEESASLRLNLLKVCHLNLEIPKMSCLDFILPMKDSLETLEVKTDPFKVNRKKKHHFMAKYQQQKIQFVGWTKDLNASNIWLLLPKLRKIVAPGEMEEWIREDWEEEVKIRDASVVVSVI